MALPHIAAHNPHFEQIGGAAAVDRLVEAFYRRVDSLPQAAGIRAMHAPDLAATRAVLKRYLCEWLGGPREYSRERGAPRLRRAHAALAIGPAERDAWLLCMRGALAEVVPDAALREQLDKAFFKIAETIRNDPENPHDRHSRNSLRAP